MLIVQNAAEPAGIRNAIVDLAALGAVEVHVASAYVTLGGSNMLLTALKDAVGSIGFLAMPKTLVTCFDFGLTQPEALRQWHQLPNAVVMVSGANRLAQGSLKPQRAFHPKLYAFSKDAHTSNALVGSANLTSRGFSVNTEAAWIQYGIERAVMNAAFERARFETTLLTDDLLAAYEALRLTQPPPPEMEQEVLSVAPPTSIGAAALPLFRSAIENGAINPASFSAMWVQGEALQGGSRNQLELPRGAHRFFGFVFTHYDYPDNITIGEPVLRGAGRVWNDRRLTWHGNNRMERMNLPTTAQGGFKYADTAAMFRRLADGSFELIVTPWDSDLARSWRQASALRHLLFRLGTSATTRLVGLL
jgi:HKD family nuclease